MAAALGGAALVPMTNSPQASADGTPVEVAIRIQSSGSRPIVNDPASPPVVAVVDSSGAVNELDVDWDEDAGAYLASGQVDDFDPEGAAWSYTVTGLVGYEDLADAIAGYDDGLTLRTADFELASAFEYSLDSALSVGGGQWTASYEGCDATCFASGDQSLNGSVEWTAAFPALSLTAIAAAGSYIKSFQVGGSAQSLASAPSPTEHTWTDARLVKNDVTLAATTAEPEDDNAQIVGPSPQGLTIAGFALTGTNRCYASPQNDDGADPTDVYYCPAAAFTSSPPAISPRSAPGQTISKTLGGEYVSALEIGDGSVSGVYFTQNVSNNGGTRTITRWELEEDFKIVVAEFVWVNMGLHLGSYTIKTTLGAGVDGFCEEAQATYKHRCWVPSGEELGFTITPNVGYYLRSVDVFGQAQDLVAADSTNPDNGAFELTTTVPAGSASVSITAAMPTTRVSVPADRLLSTNNRLQLLCRDDPAGAFALCVQSAGDTVGEIVKVQVNNSGEDPVWEYWASQIIPDLEFALVQGSTHTGQLSTGLHGPYGDQATPARGIEIGEVFVRTVSNDGTVSITQLDFASNSRVKLVDDSGPGSAPLLTDVPQKSLKPVMDADTHLSSWRVTGLTATDEWSGVRGVVWFKRSDPVLDAQDRARVIAQAGQLAVTPVDPDAELGSCAAATGGTFTCDIATREAGSDSFDVVFYAVDNSDNVSDATGGGTPEGAPARMTFYYDWFGPVIMDAFSAPDGGTCDGEQAGGTHYCNEPVDVAVIVQDVYIGLSTGTVQGGKLVDTTGLTAGDGLGSVVLTYPGTAGQAAKTTPACVIDDPDPDVCEVNSDASTGSWQVVFKSVPSQAVVDGISLSGQLTVTAWDIYGNRGEQTLTKRLQVESLRPVVDVTAETPDWHDPDLDKDWYASLGQVGFDASIADCLDVGDGSLCEDDPLQSGLKQYKVRIGSADDAVLAPFAGGFTYDSGYAGGQWVDRLRNSGEDIDQLTADNCAADGECRIEIEAVDRAGNQGSGARSVYLDSRAPSLSGLPGATSAPTMDAGAGTSSWRVSGLGAQDDGSGVRGLVWAKTAGGLPTADRVVAESLAATQDALGELGSCVGSDGEFTCDIATDETDAGSFDVVFYAVDNVGNVSEASAPLAFYRDWDGPVISGEFWAGAESPCDGGQTTEDSQYCNVPIDVVVALQDAYVGMITDPVQGGLDLDPGDADASHGAARLTYPGRPGLPAVVTAACLLEAPDENVCSVRWNEADGVWEVTFRSIPAQAVDDGVSLSGQLSATACDVYGNCSERLLDRRLEVESLDPEVIVEAGGPVWRDTVAGRDWYARTDQIGFDADIADCLRRGGDTGCLDSPPQAGLREYQVRIGSAADAVLAPSAGGFTYDSGYAAGQWVDRLRNSGEDIDQLTATHCAADGECRIEVDAVDRAGNQGSGALSVFVDRNAPVVESITFQPDQNAADPATAVILGQRPGTDAGYQHFASEEMVITVGVSDPGEQSAQGAGARQVALYLLDLGAGESQGTLFATAAVEAGKASFVLTHDFKGAVSARVTDHVGNQAGEFFAAGMLVLETHSQHALESHISSDIGVVSQSKVGTDASGLPLFSRDVTLTMGVSDTYAGVAEVGCSYITELAPQSRPCSPDLSGWNSVHGDVADAGAVTAASYAFTVSDDSNGIVLTWWVKDRAGHFTFASADTGTGAGTLDKRARLSVDKTAPVVLSVNWNGATPDSANPTHYRADRQATILVRDRNFTASGAKIATGGAASGWAQTGQREDWTYRATISYTRDADYLASAEVTYVTDLAGHSLAKPLRLPDWTLDKTPPAISISYDNNAAVNSNFYAQARTATVSVQEHNFDPSRVVLTETSALADGAQGEVAGFSWTLSDWRSDGDTHSASLRFASDGRFAFAATVADKAGNDGSALGRQEFYVDQAKPQIKLLQTAGGEPLTDGAAFGVDAVIAPVVEVTDNIHLGEADKAAVTVELTPVDERYRAIGEPVKARIDSGTSFSFDALPALRAHDGIYRLAVTARDNAGQEEKQDAVFMVNRFGSVYLFDSPTQALIRAVNPLQEPNAVAITEFNVSPLVEREVKVIRNGQDTRILDDSVFQVATGVEHGWNKATYSIPAAQFEEEGTYEVRLWTKDEVGNVNQNDVPRDGAVDAALIECTAARWDRLIDGCAEGAAITFRIDKTPPAIAVADLEQGGRYQVAEMPVRFEVTDFFEDNIDSVWVEVNGQSAEVTGLGEDQWQVTVPSAFSPQSVVFHARDKSGRESVREFGDVLVTNNRWAVWFNNRPLFLGSVFGAAIAIFGGFWLILLWRRRRRDEDDEHRGRRVA
jgi:hypothetical protein